MVVTKLAYTYIAKRRYWRFRRAGIDAALPGQPGEPEFHIKYAELLALSKSKPPEHDRASFRWLVERFEGSAEFKHLAASTQLDYSKTLRIIEDELGDEPFAITTRGMIKLVRDGMASTPRKAHKFIQTVSVLYGYAASEDLVPDGFNPAAKIRKLKAKVKPYIAWSEPEIALFLSKSPAHVITPVMLALYTGQRREDVVSMDWEDYQGTIIRVRQSKTGEPLEIACHPALRKHLAGRKTTFGGPIARAANGRPYTVNSLSQALRRACADIDGMPNRTMHGLRYAAAARLEAAGCTAGQCSSVLGHRTYQMAMKYMTQRRDSEAAIRKMGA